MWTGCDPALLVVAYEAAHVAFRLLVEVLSTLLAPLQPNTQNLQRLD